MTTLRDLLGPLTEELPQVIAEVVNLLREEWPDYASFLEEDPETVSLAIDGDPTSTAWSSEHYDTDTFAGTKSGPDPGVGIYVTTKSTTTPSEMIIRTPTPGWDAEIFASPSGPPEELSEWGEPVGDVTDAGDVEEVELHLGSPAKYFLIWFNKAAPARDQESRYQVEISDIKLID